MPERLEAVFGWVRGHADLMWGMALLSVLLFVGTLVVVPWLLARIPDDYFLHSPQGQQQGWISRHPGLRLAIRVIKNLLGAVLVVAGLAMLILPGQGLLTILMGVVLLDLPGKRKLEIALLRRRHVSRAVNWLRARRQRAPLMLPPASAKDASSSSG